MPTWGCKSMVEVPTIMLEVFITLLCIHTMPNIYYCSTCMLLYPHSISYTYLTLPTKTIVYFILGTKPANFRLYK